MTIRRLSRILVARHPAWGWRANIVNALVAAGFTVERLVEPVSGAAVLEKYPDHADERHKPDFLLIKAHVRAT